MGKTRKRTETAALGTEQLWPHLRHVTFSDVRAAAAAGFALWAIIGACAVGFYWAGEKMMPGGASADWTSPLPQWANYAVIAAIALWFLRGQTFHLRIPRWTVPGWLFMSLFAAAISFIAASSPGWVCVPLFWAAFMLITMLDSLDEQGRANVERAAEETAGGGESAIGAP